MSPTTPAPFRETIPSLQIIWRWGETTELEIIQIDRLRTGNYSSVAVLASHGRTTTYCYPASVEFVAGSYRIFDYQRPKEWTDDSWRLIDGELKIDIGVAGDPVRVLWRPKGREAFEELSEGTDWKYFKHAKVPDQPRGKIAAYRVPRPEQALVRRMLLEEFPACVLSGCAIPECLDAAHLLPVENNGREAPANMVLLRTDLHRLFDAGLLSMHVNEGRLLARCDPSVKDYVAHAIRGRKVTLPMDVSRYSEWLRLRSIVQPCQHHIDA